MCLGSVFGFMAFFIFENLTILACGWVLVKLHETNFWICNRRLEIRQFSTIYPNATYSPKSVFVVAIRKNGGGFVFFRVSMALTKWITGWDSQGGGEPLWKARYFENYSIWVLFNVPSFLDIFALTRGNNLDTFAQSRPLRGQNLDTFALRAKCTWIF